MIGRSNRFHGHSSVTRVRGPTAQCELFSVRAAQKASGDFRLAVVVSKKIDKRAVVRNRIRRRLFESIRKLGVLNGMPVDVVIFVRSAEAARISAPELDRLVSEQLLKVLARLVRSGGESKPHHRPGPHKR